jgi:archaellum biogenesis ATPase FlaH
MHTTPHSCGLIALYRLWNGLDWFAVKSVSSFNHSTMSDRIAVLQLMGETLRHLTLNCVVVLTVLYGRMRFDQSQILRIPSFANACNRLLHTTHAGRSDRILVRFQGTLRAGD